MPLPERVALDSLVARVDRDTVWYAARALDSIGAPGAEIMWQPAVSSPDKAMGVQLRVRRDTEIRTVTLRLPDASVSVLAAGSAVSKAAKTEPAQNESVREYVARRVACGGGQRP